MTATAFSTSIPYFAAPYHLGGASSNDLGTVWPVVLGGHGYMIDVQRYQRQTLETQRPAFDNQAEPGEQSLNPVGYWRKSQSRFDLGAGQEFFDDRQAEDFLTSRVGSLSSTSQRFFASKGIDCWQDNGFTLLKRTTELFDTAETNLIMADAGDYVYFAAGADLFWADGATIDSVTLPADPVGMTTDGTNIYVAYGAGQAADLLILGDDTIGAFGTLEPSLLRYANGRMVAAVGDELLELDAAGAQVGDPLVAPEFGGTWVDVVGTPVGIFAAVNVGSLRGELYVIDVDTETGGLNPGRFAGRLPNGETFNKLYFYGNVIVAGTNLGIRIFVLAGQGGQTAEMQPLIEISGGVEAMAGIGEYVWFGWSNYDSTSTGLGRMNVARTTDPETIVPPYASDVMAEGVQGTITSIAFIPGQAGRLAFGVAGQGVYGVVDDGELVPSGTFDSGWIRMGTLVEKAFAGVEVGHDPLAGTVEVSLATFEGGEAGVGGSQLVGTTFSEILGPSSVKSRAVRVKMTVSRGSVDTEAPTIRWWTLLAYPAPPRADEVILPLVLTDSVDGLDGSKNPVDVLGEIEYLRRLARDGDVVTYREFDRSEQVIVTQVITDADDARQFPQDALPTTRRWFQGPVVVRLLTKES